MKTNSLILVLLSFFLISCNRNEENHPGTFQGNWNIEGGGTIFFTEDNFSAGFGCNTIIGNFEQLGDDTIRLGVSITTLIGCDEEIANRETWFNMLLTENETFSVMFSGESLALLDKNREQVLLLIRP